MRRVLPRSVLKHLVLGSIIAASSGACGGGGCTSSCGGLEPLRDGFQLENRIENAGSVRVTNTGDTRWLKGGDQAGRVRLGLQLMTPERRLLDMDFARAELPQDVAPGESCTVPVQVRVPDAARPYLLKLDLVDEHVCWFEDIGSRPLYVSLA